MAKVKNASSNSRVSKSKKKGSYAKSYNKHTPRPKPYVSQGRV